VTFDEFRMRLEGVTGPNPKGWYSAKCPGHKDREASLGVKDGDRGIIVRCHAGCSVKTIVTALGLTLADLFPEHHSNSRRDSSHKSTTRPFENTYRKSKGPPPKKAKRAQRKTSKKQQGGRGSSSPGNRSNTRTVPPDGLRLAEYAAAKGLPEPFLRRECRLSEITLGGTPVVKMPYFDEGGVERAVRFRFRLEPGAGRFKWKTGTKAMPYGLDCLPAARAAGLVTFVEGESDQQTLRFHGVPALALPGADSWQEAWAAFLDGIGRIDVVLEPDQGGAAVRRWLASSRIRDRVRLISCAPQKDTSALYLADRAGFLAAWNAAVGRGITWADAVAAEQRAAAEAAAPAACRLLTNPRLDDEIEAAIQSTGYAGALRIPHLVHLALTSRFLERPMNLALVGPSAAGKNAVLDAARALIPPEAIYDMSAGSAHALVYEDEDYQHRVVMLAEVDSLPDEGPGASAVRSIAQDNEMIYKVVEREAAPGTSSPARFASPARRGSSPPRRAPCGCSSAPATSRCRSPTTPSRPAT
jgi:hypothetical protein